MTVRLIVQFDDRYVPSEVKKDSLIRVPYVEMSVSDVYFQQETDRCTNYTFDYTKTKVAWYRQWIELPSDIKSKHVTLNFDAVSKVAEVFINGQLAGSHIGMFGDFEVDGLISIDDLREDTGIEIPEGPYETASGFVMHFLGRIPVEHDVVGVNGIRITVLTMEGKRAGQLLISRN